MSSVKATTVIFSKSKWSHVSSFESKLKIATAWNKRIIAKYKKGKNIHSDNFMILFFKECIASVVFLNKLNLDYSPIILQV